MLKIQSSGGGRNFFRKPCRVFARSSPFSCETNSPESPANAADPKKCSFHASIKPLKSKTNPFVRSAHLIAIVFGLAATYAHAADATITGSTAINGMNTNYTVNWPDALILDITGVGGNRASDSMGAAIAKSGGDLTPCMKIRRHRGSLARIVIQKARTVILGFYRKP